MSNFSISTISSKLLFNLQTSIWNVFENLRISKPRIQLGRIFARVSDGFRGAFNFRKLANTRCATDKRTKRKQPEARHVSRNISLRSIRPAITGWRIDFTTAFRLLSLSLSLRSRRSSSSRVHRGNKGCFSAAPVEITRRTRFSFPFPGPLSAWMGPASPLNL